ncbi:hypothetical protein [Hyphobacterium indicum]|uniref:hypothetical protein n=1 Tax=Hyphobacterium indicum TaxID=2162714 RepID=UPI000D65D93B|nr:hypothetical protein [Hyphobacterium indicum]
MILTRLSRAVRDQNWFAVALEFVIVIAGVVIGFQITAWNGERAEREIIRQQLSEVRADVAAEVASLETARDAALWRLAAAEYLLVRIDAEDGLADTPVVPFTGYESAPLPEITAADHPTLLARVNLIRGQTVRNTGYNSLVSSGNLRLIRNSELRVTIQSYYAGYEDLQSNLSIFREIRAAAIPVLYRHGFSLFSNTPLAGVTGAADSDPELVAYIRTARELGQAQVSGTLQREAEAVRLLALLDAELAE